MIAAICKALGQLPDPRLRRVLTLGVGGALTAYLTLVAVVWITVSHLTLFQDHWADLGAGITLVLLALTVPVLFFPALATTIMSVFLDDAALAVEQRHYPGLPPARQQPWHEVVLGSLRFLAVMIGINLLALPLYLLLLATGLGVVLGAVINGYLLGREYYELVAVRRLPPDQARLGFRHSLGRVWVAGIVIWLLFCVPVVNLAAPVIATAFMVHVFQSLRIR